MAAGQWTAQVSGTSQDLLGIEFLDNNVGVAVGQQATVLKTTDGGITWTSIAASLSAKEDLRNVLILSPDTILVAGSSIFDGLVYRTTDGGQSWQTVTSGEDLAQVQGNLLALSYDTLHYSVDRGDSWLDNALNLGGTVLMEELLFSDDTVGYIAGNIGGFATYSAYGFRSIDGGDNWEPWWVFDLPNGNAWTRFSAPVPDTTYLFTNEFVNFVPGPSNQLVRMSGFYFETDQQINSWRFLAETVNNSMPGLIISSVFKDGTQGYAGSTNGSIYRTENGGVDWSAEYSGPDTIFQFTLLPDGRVSAVGSNGLILLRAATNPVEERISEVSVQLYPNPTSDWLQVKNTPFAQAEASLYDAQGRLLRTFPWSSGEPIGVQQLPAGNYLLKFRVRGQVFLGRFQKMP